MLICEVKLYKTVGVRGGTTVIGVQKAGQINSDVHPSPQSQTSAMHLSYSS